MSSTMSTPPLERSAYPSPTQTAVDLNATIEQKLQKPDATSEGEQQSQSQPQEAAGAELKLSQRKKWSLLAVFSLGFFVDIWSYSAFFIFTGPISADLKVSVEQQSWIITSYAVTFAAFLLFWGRVSDLYSAKPVFVIGFFLLGVLNLVISFLPDKYSFFVLRAISGISGATLIPAAFRLITAVFEPHELGKAFTLYGMSGALANTTGIIIAGFIEYIPSHGQLTAWRWFFRLIAAVIIPVSVGSFFWIPKPQGTIAHVDGKWKRLDLVGSFSMLFGIILLILSLTLGASYGWGKAGFIAPFVLSWFLIVFFFIWESKLPEDYALLPSKTWKIPNFALLIAFALYIYSWWSLNFLPLVEQYVRVHHERAIIAAVRLLPQGVIAGVMTILLTLYPKLVSRPRWTIVIAMVFAIVGYVLMSQSGTQIGADYWKFIFTGGVLGSAGMMTVFTGTNVAVMTSVPAEMAGVAGAVLQVALQVGSAIALSIQAGLFTIKPGNVENFENVKISFYVVIGWGIVWLIGFIVLYRPSKNAVSSDEDGAEQGEPKRVIIAH